MEMSNYQIAKKLGDYKRARALYQQGFTTRDVAKIMGKSNQWVWLVARGKGIKELEKLHLADLTLRRI
jgi:hypothetical protein